VPKKYITETAFIAFILLGITVGMVVLETGGAASPFIALWMFISVIGGVFGAQALIPLVIAVNLYLVVVFTQATLSKEMIVGIALGGELPLLLSYLLWHSKTQGESNNERAYYDLANELNQVSNKAEVVINAIGEGVIAIDNKGIIQLINPAAQHIIGWGRQDALNLDYKSVLHLVDKKGDELTKANDPVFDVLTTNQSKSRNDLQLITNSGKKLNVSVVASPVGRMGAGAIIVVHDITKEQAEEREQAEFISTASHEMRTPVASIEGYLGLALNPATATIDDKARDFISKAHESAQHLGRLFQDLLDVTKAEDGRLANNPRVVDVVEYTKEIIDGLKPRADAKNLRVFFKPETTSSSVTGGEHSIAPVFYAHLDRDHLREVLANLIENAIKYTPKGEVVVDVIGDNEHIIVSITDSGIGIPAEDIPHLFQKFYRVDNSDTREIGGTGLGLYLCRRLTEAMNGRIWVESEYKKGSTFYVELPRITHEEATKLIEQAEAEEASKEENPSRKFASGGTTFGTSAGEDPARALVTETSGPQIILSHAKDITPGQPTSPTTATAPAAPPQTAPPPPVGQPLTPGQPHVIQPLSQPQPGAAPPATEPERAAPTNIPPRQ
jgi:PAS domain S-box-containing protein